MYTKLYGYFDAIKISSAIIWIIIMIKFKVDILRVLGGSEFYVVLETPGYPELAHLVFDT